jgi:hypothetical protein
VETALLFLILAVAGQWHGTVSQPDCTGVDRWPSAMAYVQLKNEGLLGPDTTDFKKTRSIRIASEQTGEDLFHQVHLVTFTKLNGEVIEVITVNDASSEECSMSGVDLFVVRKHLGA